MNIAVKGLLPCNDCKDIISLVRKICLFLAGMVVLSSSGVRAQQASAQTLEQLSAYFTDAFQADQHLIHGTRYYNLYPAAPGNPFLEPDEFRTGRAIINDRESKDVRR